MGRNCIDIPEDVLYQKYIVEELSTNKIANNFNCSPHTILSNLRKFNIPIRSYSESMIIDRGVDIDKTILYEKYIIDKCTTRDAARIFNCSQSTLRRYLKKYNLPIRSCSDAQINSHEYKFDKRKWDLYYYYIIKEMSAAEIAKIFNCSSTLINFWLHKHNISIRAPPENFRGSKNPAWKGGITEQKYCYKFNDQFKEYIRDKFNRTCYICEKTEDDLDRKLDVHHIDYNKSSICNGKEFAFVPLCHSCHAKTNGNRWYWFNLLINYWLDKYEIYNDLTMY